MTKKRETPILLPGGARVEMLEPDLALLSFPLAAPRLPAALTEVEQEIVLLLFEGATNEAIANKRGVSPRTVTNQLESIYRKLGVSSRAELVRLLRGAG